MTRVSRRWRGGLAAAAVLVLLQFVVPVALGSEPHGFFQWRMFAEGGDIRSIELVDEAGVRHVVDHRSISFPRAEITADTWARAICDFHDDAVTVVVDARSGVLERTC